MRYFHAELTVESIQAISSNTPHVVTGFNFMKYLDGIQVGMKIIPLTVKLKGEFAQKLKVDGQIVKITKTAFLDEQDKPINDLDIIHLELGDAGFRYGVRFKKDVSKIYVN
jgi:hypothetical protein